MFIRPFVILSLLAIVGAGCASQTTPTPQLTPAFKPEVPTGLPSETTPGATGVPTGTAESQTWDVSIADFLFTQDTLTVKRGDRIAFTNKDAVDHSASADGGAFDTGIIAPESTAVIDTSSLAPGAYGYHCVVHTNMKGMVIVE